jgi:hypothetical protein
MYLCYDSVAADFSRSLSGIDSRNIHLLRWMMSRIDTTSARYITSFLGENRDYNERVVDD